MACARRIFQDAALWTPSQLAATWRLIERNILRSQATERSTKTWFASARHYLPWWQEDWWGTRLGDKFEEDNWELYNLQLDFSQSRDLASTYPERLARLKSLFNKEAKKNLVFPLGAGLIGPGPHAVRRREYVYHAGFPSTPLVSDATPDFGISHTIRADIELDSRAARGVIVAAGDRISGFTLFLEEGAISYMRAAAGRCRAKVQTAHVLRRGIHRVSLKLNYLGEDRHRTQVIIKLDGEPLAERVISCLALPSSDNLDIGKDTGEPVGGAYQAPNHLQGGRISKVVISTMSEGTL
jgi:arylsulfatase